MTKIIVLTVTIIIILALIAFRQHLRLKAKAKECAKETQEFHNKIKRLTEPSHFFTDEELNHIKNEYAPLLDKIYELYDSVLISRSYLDNLGLKNFLHERKFLNHLQYQNNQRFQK